MRLLKSFVSLALMALPALAQQCVLTVQEPVKLRVARNGASEYRLTASLPNGCHANSNTPAEDFLIPLKLTWTAGTVEAAETVYPKGTMEKYDFSEKPMSVVGGSFEIVTRFRRMATASPGPSSVAGKLRYQACNDKMCFPPKTVDIKLPLLIE